MVEEIIKNWKIAQDAGAHLPCPRCGNHRMQVPATRNAISRRADIYVCDSCGTLEAIEDIPCVADEKKLPLTGWFVVQNVFRQSEVIRKGNRFEVVASHSILLTTEDIDDIMVCALEGGINYWCTEAEVPEDRRVADWGHEQIVRGGVLILHESDEDKTYELTLQKFLTGFKMWVERGLDHYKAVEGNEVDTCRIDASCADNIIQLALWGDIIYG